MRKIDPRAIRQAARILRVIGHPDRLRIVEELEGGGRTVTDLMRVLRLGQVEVSKHLAAMKRQGIVESRAKANFRTYTVKYRNVINVLDCLRKHSGGAS